MPCCGALNTCPRQRSTRNLWVKQARRLRKPLHMLHMLHMAGWSGWQRLAQKLALFGQYSTVHNIQYANL